MKARSVAVWALAAALGPALASGSFAQQGAQPAAQPGAKAPAPHEGEGRQDVMPEDPVLAKKWIERRLEETSKREERLRASLKKLEQGASPAEVGKDLDPNARQQERRQGDADNKTPRNPDRPNVRAKMTPEDREMALQFLKENSATLTARFDKMIVSDPATADRILGHMIGRIREMKADKERNPALFKLRLEEMEGGAILVDAVKAYRDAKNATPVDANRVGQATEQLRSALARQLDNRLSVQANEIDSLTRRLADLKDDLEKKKAARETTIDSMLAKVSEGKDARELSPGDRGAEASRRGPDGPEGEHNGPRP